jgi:hypothetical protein
MIYRAGNFAQAPPMLKLLIPILDKALVFDYTAKD